MKWKKMLTTPIDYISFDGALNVGASSSKTAKKYDWPHFGIAMMRNTFIRMECFMLLSWLIQFLSFFRTAALAIYLQTFLWYFWAIREKRDPKSKVILQALLICCYFFPWPMPSIDRCMYVLYTSIFNAKISHGSTWHIQIHVTNKKTLQFAVFSIHLYILLSNTRNANSAKALHKTFYTLLSSYTQYREKGNKMLVTCNKNPNCAIYVVVFVRIFSWNLSQFAQKHTQKIWIKVWNGFCLCWRAHRAQRERNTKKGSF